MAEEKKSSGRGQRDLRVRVKTAKGRRLSSTLWLERQLNDPYVQKAQKDGYRGRAAYKILELDDNRRNFLFADRLYLCEIFSALTIKKHDLVTGFYSENIAEVMG